MTAEIERPGRVVVVSPHLDDASLSIGAAIARMTRTGLDVAVVTVFAGDPGSNAAAASWDRDCGFESAAAAVRGRRAEDLRACAILGATAVWLPFPDAQYPAVRDAGAIWTALGPELADAESCLLPGFPLAHPDHAWVTSLVLERAVELGCRIGFYAEQPYARAGVASASPAVAARWYAASASRRELRLKGKACRAYRSQFRGLRRHLPRRLLLPELFRVEERLAWG